METFVNSPARNKSLQFDIVFDYKQIPVTVVDSSVAVICQSTFKQHFKHCISVLHCETKCNTLFQLLLARDYRTSAVR